MIGKPVPQGSKRVFNGRVVDVNAADLRNWRELVARAWDGPCTLSPLSIVMDFYFARPKGHYGKKGLRPSAPTDPAVRPDLDKLIRAVLDALTGVAFHDDAQVCGVLARKHYASPPRTLPGLRLEMQEIVPSDTLFTLHGERSGDAYQPRTLEEPGDAEAEHAAGEAVRELPAASPDSLA